MSEGPKIAILGAGSVGCFIGGAWQSAGLPVTFIGRRAIADEVDRHGLTVSDYSGWQVRLAPGDVDYRCGPEALAQAQLIVVAVKSGATAAAAAEIAEHATTGATVMSFQNGISNVETLERGLGGRFEVGRGIVGFNVAHLGDGVFHKGVEGQLWADRRDLNQKIAEMVTEGPGALTLSSDISGLAWGKLLINMNNAVNALSGRTLRNELAERDYRRVFAACIREGLAILKRAKIEPAKVGPVAFPALARALSLPDWLFKRTFFRKWQIDPKARSSMSDDLAAGRPTEIDYLNGELVRIAEELHMAAPVNRAIVDLVHKAEDGAPPLPPQALAQAVLGG